MKNGQCTRLRQGAFKDIVTYSDTPEKVAVHWQKKGTSSLHLMDLDGALAGYSVNEKVIRRTADTVSIPVEIGSGIRSREAVKRMLDLRVRRVIIGTKTAERLEFLRDMVRTSGEEVIVADMDAKGGMVVVEGWEKVSSLITPNLCLAMKEYGVRHIVYISISRDGMLSGSNVEVIRRFTEETGLDTIASGGVLCMEDLKCLYETDIGRAIVGKALYENRIGLAETVRLCEA